MIWRQWRNNKLVLNYVCNNQINLQGCGHSCFCCSVHFRGSLVLMTVPYCHGPLLFLVFIGLRFSFLDQSYWISFFTSRISLCFSSLLFGCFHLFLHLFIMVFFILFSRLQDKKARRAGCGEIFGLRELFV